MKQSRAVAKYLRVAPRKVRPVVRHIVKKSYAEAERFLRFSNNKGSRLVLKALESAAANAEVKYDLDRQNLVVVGATVDDGPRMKRSRSCSRGRRAPVLKRMSHVNVVVGE